MAAARWTTIEDFLSDLPKYHCTVKPRHSFCTVCLRINHDVAFDCPLREMPDDPAGREAYVPRRTSAALESSSYLSAGADDVPAAVLAEGPLIEFAPSSEPPVKRRMRAKPLDSRATGPPAAPPAARPRPPREPTSALAGDPAADAAAPTVGAASAPTDGPQGSVEQSQGELKGWDAGPQPPAPLEAPPAVANTGTAPDETEAPQKGPKRGRWRNR